MSIVHKDIYLLFGEYLRVRYDECSILVYVPKEQCTVHLFNTQSSAYSPHRCYICKKDFPYVYSHYIIQHPKLILVFYGNMRIFPITKNNCQSLSDCFPVCFQQPSDKFMKHFSKTNYFISTYLDEIIDLRYIYDLYMYNRKPIYKIIDSILINIKTDFPEFILPPYYALRIEQ
jgi:hypothetical protein